MNLKYIGTAAPLPLVKPRPILLCSLQGVYTIITFFSSLAKDELLVSLGLLFLFFFDQEESIVSLTLLFSLWLKEEAVLVVCGNQI